MKRRDHVILLVLFAILFLAVADNQILSPLLPLLSSDLGVSVRWLGQLVSGYALASGMVAFGLAAWSDRLGRPVLIRWALLAFAFASLICSQSQQFWMLLVGRLVTGIAAGVLSFNIIAYVGDRFSYSERGRAMGVVYSAYFAALMAGVPVGAWIADGLGWQAVFLVGAVLALGLYSATGFFPTSSSIPRNGANATATQYGLGKAREFLQAGPTRRGVTASFLVSGGIVCFLTYLGAWLHDVHGLNTRQIGTLFMLSGFAALVASPICGYLSDRIGKVRAFLLGNGTAAFCIAVLPWVVAGPVLWVSFFVLSLAAALRQSPFEAIITEIVPSESRGRYIAFRNMFSQLGIASAVFVAGILYDSLGYVSVGVLAAGLTAAASLFIPRIKERAIGDD